jgi:hypothetical protein
MTDNPFAHVEALKITSDKTSWCPLPGLFADSFPEAKDPEIEVRYAGEENLGYWNAWLSATATGYGESLAEAKRTKNGADPDGLVTLARRLFEEQQRHTHADRDLYPTHVVVGWRNVIDLAGDEVEFSPALAHKLVGALPKRWFDMLRAHAGTEANFRQRKKLAPEAKAALLGNSESVSPGN